AISLFFSNGYECVPDDCHRKLLQRCGSWRIVQRDVCPNQRLRERWCVPGHLQDTYIGDAQRRYRCRWCGEHELHRLLSRIDERWAWIRRRRPEALDWSRGRTLSSAPAATLPTLTAPSNGEMDSSWMAIRHRCAKLRLRTTATSQKES